MEKQKGLILYFSHTGENYTPEGIRNIDKGNTEVIAEMIRELTGSDMFKAEPVKKYPYSYKQCTDRALREKNMRERPELKEYLSDIEEYEIIYIGYPNWWGTLPMGLAGLLERLDFTGKTIKPFCTHEGSAMGTSENDLRKLCKNGILKRGLPIRGSRVYEAMPRVKQWVLEDK